MDERQAPAPPKVSVLIVSHNNAVALRRCLQALDRSSGRDEMEIIVADNASRDESSTLDSVFPGATFLRMPRHFGRTKALNIATRTAAAELLLLLSPNVEVGPDTVRTLAAALDAEPDAVAVCPLLRTPDGEAPPQVYQLPQSGELYALWRTSDSLRAIEPPEDAPKAVGYAPFNALLVRKIFIRGLNYLDERYGEFGGDLELARQIRRIGKKI
ncbi:MAG: glycosyltransferase family 2 protein, partial [Bryobacteraceae bacterium]